MLQTVEVISSRSELRRAVDTTCQIVADAWDVPIDHAIQDLSSGGMWVESMFPLEVGEDIVVAIQPPPRAERGEGEASADEPIHVLGRVRRVSLGRRSSDPPRAGMGIEFLHVEECATDRLARSLHGIPPRIPGDAGRPASRQEMVWVGEVREPISTPELDALFDATFNVD